MRNLLTIAAFEFRTRTKRISTWVYFAVFFALAMLWVAAAGGAIQGAKIAENTKMDTNTTPMAANGLWRAMRGSEMAMVDMGDDEVNRGDRQTKA